MGLYITTPHSVYLPTYQLLLDITIVIEQERAAYDMLVCSTPIAIQAIVGYIICYHAKGCISKNVKLIN